MKRQSILVLTIVILFGSICFADITIDFVTVGNPGNANDDTGYGGVSYVYQIGKYEVTAGQYTEFLNAVAATDTYGLYNIHMWDVAEGCKIQQSGSPGSYTYSVAPERANRPVSTISWYDALRFSNWLHNGQGSGDTEDGAYDMSLGPNVVRKADALFWLPNEDEWYKAAYHKNDGITGNYWEFPTATDSVPSNALINPDPGNNANFYESYYTIGSPYYTTEVGEFENSDSPYGTFDMGGNVWEWNESLSDNVWRWDKELPGFERNVRGGSAWTNGYNYMKASESGYGYPQSFEVDSFGFRVASVPVPGAFLLGTLGLSLAGWKLRKRKEL